MTVLTRQRLEKIKFPANDKYIMTLFFIQLCSCTCCLWMWFVLHVVNVMPSNKSDKNKSEKHQKKSQNQFTTDTVTDNNNNEHYYVLFKLVTIFQKSFDHDMPDFYVWLRPRVAFCVTTDKRCILMQNQPPCSNPRPWCLVASTHKLVIILLNLSVLCNVNQILQ